MRPRPPRPSNAIVAGSGWLYRRRPEDLRRLCEAGKVILTPHIAAATDAAFTRMGVEAARNTLASLEGETPDRNYMANPEILETP